jgi:hypothetical protein
MQIPQLAHISTLQGPSPQLQLNRYSLERRYKLANDSAAVQRSRLFHPNPW